MEIRSKAKMVAGISAEMLGRGVLFGTLFGAGFGTCIIPFLGTIFGAIYGFLMGIGLGIMAGLLNAMIALICGQNLSRASYLWVFAIGDLLICLVACFTGSTVLGEAWRGNVGRGPSLIFEIIPGFIAGAVAAWQSRNVVRWVYPDEKKKKMKPKQMPIDAWGDAN